MIGASGAVSGVLGAYLVLFPHSRVLTLVIFGFFWRLVSIPAVVVLGFWIVLQVLNGLGTLGEAGSVAWFAHIGGFFAGHAPALSLMRPRTPDAPVNVSGARERFCYSLMHRDLPGSPLPSAEGQRSRRESVPKT